MRPTSHGRKSQLSPVHPRERVETRPTAVAAKREKVVENVEHPRESAEDEHTAAFGDQVRQELVEEHELGRGLDDVLGDFERLLLCVRKDVPAYFLCSAESRETWG